jgi:hypothetical protein
VESYTLQFSTASDFGSVLFSRNMLSTESFDTTGVAASTKYYWRVRTVNRGILSPWSAAFSYTTQSSVDVKEETVIPLMFMIEQNYPNPFNPSTIIHYAIPTRSHVRLQIYNTLGLLVSELVNGDQNAGYQSIVWNATVASGLYFYRIEASEVGNPANRFIETKKMILLK